jgi:hypothetical protein
MVSKIEPDRYADTGFSVKDTAQDVNDVLFRAMMQRGEGERLLMGMEMQATARALVWASIPENLPEPKRRNEFYTRFFGEPCPW